MAQRRSIEAGGEGGRALVYAALIAVAAAFAVFFGGRIDDIRVKRGTSAGQVVH